MLIVQDIRNWLDNNLCFGVTGQEWEYVSSNFSCPTSKHLEFSWREYIKGKSCSIKISETQMLWFFFPLPSSVPDYLNKLHSAESAISVKHLEDD